MKPHWHIRFLALAAHVATWSRDPDKKVGSVVVRPDKTIATMGFNGFPRGVEDTDARYIDRNLKLDMVVHAEMNALLQCHDVNLIHTCYVTVSPCVTCTKLLLNTACQRVIYVERYAHDETACGLWTRLQRNGLRREWLRLTAEGYSR